MWVSLCAEGEGAGAGVGEPDGLGKRGRCLESERGMHGYPFAVVAVSLERAVMPLPERLVGRGIRNAPSLAYWAGGD